jgi:hypothetical protein
VNTGSTHEIESFPGDWIPYVAAICSRTVSEAANYADLYRCDRLVERHLDLPVRDVAPPAKGVGRTVPHG